MIGWTSPFIMRDFGVWPTYLALIMFNLFPTSYSIVCILTEPLTLCLTMWTYLLYRRGKYVAASLCAGAATAVRPTGIAVSMALSVGIAIATIRERPRLRTWLVRALAVALSAWGLCTLLAVWHFRMGDAFIYSHARTRYYNYTPNPFGIFWVNHRIIAQSIWSGINDGVWLAAGLLWFAIGHRKAMSRFEPNERSFWYGLYLFSIGIAAVSSVAISFGGCSRYVLMAVPTFFAMAAAMEANWTLIVLWGAISFANYWSVNACFYEGRGQPNYLERCNLQPQ